MNNLDRLSIIAKLQMLNQLCNQRIEESKTSIEFWENRIENFGQNAVIPSEEACNGMLRINVSNINFHEGIVNENNRLINVLEEELNLSEE